MFQTEGSRKWYISQNVINRIERVLLEFKTWIKGLRLDYKNLYRKSFYFD